MLPLRWKPHWNYHWRKLVSRWCPRCILQQINSLFCSWIGWLDEYCARWGWHKSEMVHLCDALQSQPLVACWPNKIDLHSWLRHWGLQSLFAENAYDVGWMESSYWPAWGRRSSYQLDTCKFAPDWCFSLMKLCFKETLPTLKASSIKDVT